MREGTSPDTEHLFTSLGLSAFPYCEIVSSEEQRAACERWPLLVATHEELALGIPLEEPEVALALAQDMEVCA